MKQKTKQLKDYKINIPQTDPNGSFHCPNCGLTISPNDTSEETYTIYRTIIKENNLNEIVLYCKGCLSFIHLIGFQKLQFLK
jgi:predicted RNA-binding Zn-ribbon protein involved in translation (DUF1610 family)